MAQKDISIEYAHIYTNNRISEEHTLSLEILGSLLKELHTKNLTTSLVILVDDYSFPDPTFSYDEFIHWLSTNHQKPDILFRESQLIPLCDITLNKINNHKLKQNIIDYIKTKKYPCSLFIATWYLLRLGYLETTLFPPELTAKKIINILPKSFEPFENQALEIISNTEFSKATEQIEYRYLEGRLLA